MMSAEKGCTLCPRMCAVRRDRGALGFCGEGDTVRAAAALLHFGEEPPVSGRGGSGTVFFTGCTLKCSFCQNYQISMKGMGKILHPDELAEIFLRLQAAGAENINLVTGTHFTNRIAEAADSARDRGLTIPFVWNSSGFDSVYTLDLIRPYMSVYLPDLKTVSAEYSGQVYDTSLYAEAARTAVKLMVKSAPLTWNGGRLVSGVIVRHMVLPGFPEVTRQVLEWFAREIGDAALFSLMFQYTPVGNPGPVARRSVTQKEYNTVLGWLDEFGIDEGFVQDLENDTEWLPDFNKGKPFPSGDSKVLWHWRGES